MTTCGCDLEWQVQRTIGYVRQPFWSLDIKVGHHESHIFHLNFLHAVHDLLYGSHHTHKTPWHYHIPYILIIRVSERKDKGRCPLGTLYTRDWEPVTIAIQAPSLVERVEPVQVRFTLRLRVQRSMWMQNGCQVYMDSYFTSNGSCFLSLGLFSKTTSWM